MPDVVAIPATPRFVAYLDMLGFASLTLQHPDAAWSALAGLETARQEILRLGIELTSSREVIADRIESFTFSDSIVLATRADENADVFAIVLLCTEVFSRALSYSVPIRAGIAHGQFRVEHERHLFAGPPLVEAYRLSEQSQWLGIRVDDAVADRTRAIPIRSATGHSAVTRWRVPLKCGASPESNVVDWVHSHHRNFKKTLPIATPDLYSMFAPIFGPFADLGISVRTKYENTVAFINANVND